MEMTVSIEVKTGRQTSKGLVKLIFSKEYEVGQILSVGVSLKVDLLGPTRDIYREVVEVLLKPENIGHKDYVVILEPVERPNLTTVELVKELKDTAVECGWRVAETVF